MLRTLAITALALALCATACTKKPYEPDSPQSIPEKTVDPYAPQTQVDPWGANSTDEVVWVRQNWTGDWRLEWAFTSQGSRLIPYAWYLALEDFAGSGKFHSDATYLRYRYLLQKPGPRNPDGLPYGFTIDLGDDARTSPRRSRARTSRARR